jgi:hypothetical protein
MIGFAPPATGRHKGAKPARAKRAPVARHETVIRGRVRVLTVCAMTIQTGTTERSSSATTDRAILLVVCLVALLGLVAVATMTG